MRVSRESSGGGNSGAFPSRESAESQAEGVPSRFESAPLLSPPLDSRLTLVSNLETMCNSVPPQFADASSALSNIITMANTQHCHDVHQELTSEEKKYAMTYLNETDETKKNAIAEIKRWIQESDDLSARNDDFFILRFLRICKFNVEETKIKMRYYYKLRSELPELYVNRDPFQPELRKVLDLGPFLTLLKPDDQGRMVIIAPSTRHDPKIHKLLDIIKIDAMMLDIALRDYTTGSVYGVVIYIDLFGMNLRHIAQCRPRIMMKMAHLLNCYPLNFKSINFINTPGYFDATLRIFKMFMKEELRSVLHVYRTTQDCFTDIPANILPVEYGGTEGTLQELTEYWKKVAEENRDWFIDDEKYKMTISKQ